ncbi:MAG: AAA family ATPase [Candidatus Bilamarchaeaceae archaeon]
MIFVLCGLPGTGKSTLARALATKLKCVHISTDNVRLEFLKRRTYSQKEKFFVYDKMLEKAENQLKKEKNVILDGTFYLKSLREKVKTLGEKNRTFVILIECTLSEKEVRKRLFNRKADESEADFEIYKKVKREFEPIKERHLIVDCSKPIKKQISDVLHYSRKFSQFYLDTHISRVYFCGDFVYKIKKPVKFSFLDFSTLKKRKFFCEEEVRLNKRLCPDIYLRVVKAEKHFGGYLFGTSDADEYAVKMRKLPMERQMDKLLEKRKVSKKIIKEISSIVADFHKRIKVIKDKHYGNPELIQKQINDLSNHREVIESAIGKGRIVDFSLKKCALFNEKNKELFRKRQREGFIRDCHGDLHSANIILANKIYIFDCIEFNKDFRFVDVASEIAFMAMDLDSFGREDLSKIFVDTYVNITKDHDLYKLLNYYKCYRANVRLKVAAIEYAQNKREDIKERMLKYAKLMEMYAYSL